MRLSLSGTECLEGKENRVLFPVRGDPWPLIQVSLQCQEGLHGARRGPRDENGHFPTLGAEGGLLPSPLWGSQPVGFVCWFSCQSPSFAMPAHPPQSRRLDGGGGAEASGPHKTFMCLPLFSQPPMLLLLFLLLPPAHPSLLLPDLFSDTLAPRLFSRPLQIIQSLSLARPWAWFPACWNVEPF